MGNWKAGFEKWFGGGPGGSKRVRTLMWLILIGLLGAALMIMNSFLNVRDVNSVDKSPRASPDPNQAASALKWGTNDQSSMFREYEDAYEIRLRDILQKIVGVGEVEVLVSIDSTEETVVDKNYQDSQSMTNERDNGGATRSISEQTRKGDSVMVQSSGDEHPLVLKYTRPKVRGVIVVAKGAENLAVKKMIIEAVERGIDVPAHRISVLPRKQ
jgi:stage III sporulation protein AG